MSTVLALHGANLGSITMPPNAKSDPSAEFGIHHEHYERVP